MDERERLIRAKFFTMNLGMQKLLFPDGAYYDHKKPKEVMTTLVGMMIFMLVITKTKVMMLMIVVIMILMTLM